MNIKIVAEIGINHSGSMETAKKLIDVCAAAGCDYVKFQKRTIDRVYSAEDLAKPRESPWGTTTKEQKEGIEFSYKDYKVINAYCQGKIGWFVSPWDYASTTLMFSTFDLPYLKIPSALITNNDFLKVVRKVSEKEGVPIILSTGGSTLDMVDHAVSMVGKANIGYILHCVSTYPSRREEQQLAVIPRLIDYYSPIKIGFSNHFPGLDFMKMAIAMRVQMIEFHVTLDRAGYGSDQAASIEPPGIHNICNYIKLYNEGMGDGEKRIMESEIPIMEKLRR